MSLGRKERFNVKTTTLNTWQYCCSEILNIFAKIKKGSTAESALRGKAQFDASRRGKKELKSSRDKNARHEP